MSVYRDEGRGAWYVQASYHDSHGARHRTTKRGFATRREAQAWERDFGLANGAIEVRDLGELGELARAVGFVSRNNIRSLAEMERAISRSRDGSQAARLKALRESCDRYGLLPQTAPKPTTGRRPGSGHEDRWRRSYDDGSHQRQHEQSAPSRGREL